VTVGLGAGGQLTGLRTLRIFSVLSRLASRWPSLKVLLKAMVKTAYSLNYWLVLFILMLFICASMFQAFFSTKFHFEDVETLGRAVDTKVRRDWCSPPAGNYTWHFNREDCIPRANFDTLLWALVTTFQIMTGEATTHRHSHMQPILCYARLRHVALCCREHDVKGCVRAPGRTSKQQQQTTGENWNTIMYAGMRAGGWPFILLFVAVIFLGQILFLSVFLSMLLNKFDEALHHTLPHSAGLCLC